MATSQDFVNWVCGPDLNADYLRYLLMTEQAAIQRFASGSVHQTMYYPEAKALHACLPERPVQDRVVELLGALDDKIDANRQAMVTTSHLARAKFSLWHLLRRPVLASLGDYCTIYDGPHATPPRIDDGSFFLNISSLDEGRLDLSKSDHVSESDFEIWTRRVAPLEGDVLFSYETRLGEAALMPSGVKACLGRRMALLRVKPQMIYPSILLQYFLGDELQSLIRERAIHGATVDRIGLREMANWPVRIPSIDQQSVIGEVLTSLHKLDWSLELENRALIEMRDTLLPHLMSGRLKVKDADRILSDAV